MISLPTASRKAAHLACWSSAGNGTAHPIACPNQRTGRFSFYFESPPARLRAHFDPIPYLAEPPTPPLAIVAATKSP